MRRQDYLVYAPPLVIEVLSPSNQRGRSSVSAWPLFSGGTREFWVVARSAQRRSVVAGSSSVIYTVEDLVPVTVLPALLIAP